VCCGRWPLSDPLATLRRFPDAEAPNLVAVDASDRLVLDEARADVAAAAPATVSVIGDNYGALAIGSGAEGVRVFQDSLVGELALANNAGGLDYRSLPLDEELLSGATVVLMQLPKSLDQLDEWAGAVARWADPSVVLYAGGRVKHMTLEMNAILGRHFDSVAPSLARQKSRVLVARGPRPAEETFPRREYSEELGLWVVAHGGVFAGTRLDLGTRLLLSVLDDAVPDAADIVDLGSGSGILAASLARSRPGARVTATDQSWAAAASATATMLANDLDVTVVRDLGLATRPDASADLVVLNPPFHSGSAVDSGLARALFEDAARVLRPGGELWTVFNSHLGYRPTLQRTVGPTREVTRNAKFTVTASRSKTYGETMAGNETRGISNG
jgi:16S rRNA (guanine1207-N2)-methyltransferase